MHDGEVRPFHLRNYSPDFSVIWYWRPTVNVMRKIYICSFRTDINPYFTWNSGWILSIPWKTTYPTIYGIGYKIQLSSESKTSIWKIIQHRECITEYKGKNLDFVQCVTVSTSAKVSSDLEQQSCNLSCWTSKPMSYSLKIPRNNYGKYMYSVGEHRSNISIREETILKHWV